MATHSATQQTFERVRRLMADGLSGKAAFERIASETGESAGTVQARYYRAGRKAGVVNVRGGRTKAAASAAKATGTAKRRGRPPGSRTTTAAPAAKTAPAASGSVADRLDAAARLLREAAAEIRALEADAARWRQVRGLLS
jgi:uncharacterized protein YoaH (UPF0181 family)